MFDDFKDLLSAFNDGNVRYLIVGGYAVSLHAQPRATKDLDILISADPENSNAVYFALAKFGAPLEGLSARDFADPNNFFRMGTPPVMVDIMPRISGVEFDEAWNRRVNVAVDDKLMVPFISRQDLLVAKISAGRSQDLADADALRRTIDTENVDQQKISGTSMPASSEVGRIQVRGREDWLKMRRNLQAENDQLSDPKENDVKKSSGMSADEDLD